MNQKQYDIVTIFLKMGSKPKDIAKHFKIDLTEVLKVQASLNYEQYQSGEASPFGDLFGSDWLKHFGG